MPAVMQGMMFLPDGRVLIMDKELYQKTLDQSIVLDLFESGSNAANTSTSQENDLEEEKQGVQQQVTTNTR
jgi:hypothetical protein